MLVTESGGADVPVTVTDMMERAVKAGFYKDMPDEKIIYVP